ncbi:D-tyrosyl-tRNA(Tyr) deacylase [candidate division KSB1 bacterium]|nr:D-tyrosyl-tRNA(Tyr) deacylase [candidate division KSB1 bacterium]
MRVVVQRVSKAKVTIDKKVIGKIGRGLVILLGVSEDDTSEDAQFLADKCVNLRIFNDDKGKMNLSALDIGGEILSISQFTLYGDCRKGRRPSFIKAARPERGKELYDRFNEILRESRLKIETGEFGGMMDVDIYNEGPVTIIIDSKH